MTRPYRILVTGSRSWDDWHTVEGALRGAFLKQPADTDEVVVVHGGARGADTCAAVLAPRMGLRVEVHPADWQRYGRRAGIVRNTQMIQAGADICLAFIKDGSPGASHCAREAAKAGIPVVRHELTSETR